MASVDHESYICRKTGEPRRRPGVDRGGGAWPKPKRKSRLQRQRSMPIKYVSQGHLHDTYTPGERTVPNYNLYTIQRWRARFGVIGPTNLIAILSASKRAHWLLHIENRGLDPSKPTTNEERKTTGGLVGFRPV